MPQSSQFNFAVFWRLFGALPRMPLFQPKSIGSGSEGSVQTGEFLRALQQGLRVCIQGIHSLLLQTTIRLRMQIQRPSAARLPLW